MVKINGAPINASTKSAHPGDIVSISDIDMPLFVEVTGVVVLLESNIVAQVTISGSQNTIKGKDNLRIITSNGYNNLVSVGDNCHIGGEMNGAIVVAGKRCKISIKGGGNLVSTLDGADIVVADESLVYASCDSKIVTGNRSISKAFTNSNINAGDDSLVSVHGNSTIAVNRNCMVSILNENQGPTKVSANVGSIAACSGVSHEFKMKHYTQYEDGAFTSKRKYSVGKRSITLTEEEFLEIVDQRNGC